MKITHARVRMVAVHDDDPIAGPEERIALTGGITPWLKVAGMAEAFNTPVVNHIMPEFQAQLVAAMPALSTCPPVFRKQSNAQAVGTPARSPQSLGRGTSK